jgi:uncharacterized membrane protein
MSLPIDAKIVLGAFTVSGIVHLVKPEVFKPLMPKQLPAHREIIVGSGVAELVCAVGLAIPATRRVAGIASAALLVGVFPGNVKMALDSRRSKNNAYKVAAIGRLPLQIPLIRGALRAGRA